MIVGAKELEGKLHKLASEFDAHKAAKLERAAAKLAPLVGDAAAASIGDHSMSGWKRGAPIEIVGKVVKRDGVAIAPTAAGPMRVLNDGRQAHEAGGRRTAGTYKSKKTGDVRQKYRKVKRSMGATAGKGTWDDAANKIADEFPKLMADELHQVMRETFTEG